MKEKISQFGTNRNIGFNMTFENGFTISVQWGTENYCARRFEKKDPRELRFWRSRTAEIAVLNEKDEFIKINNGSDGVVSGWLSTDTVAEVIAIVSSAKTQKEIEKKCLTLSLY